MLVKKVRVERTRRFGDCYLGLELWKRLGLAEFFAPTSGPWMVADVPWSRVAAVLAINRLCAPGSELAVERALVSLHGVGRSVAHREQARSTIRDCIAAWIVYCR